MLPLVAIGPCAQEHRDYLAEMQHFGDKWFHYIGVLENDDPALPSAYAGSSVFLLPSQDEVQPISALEAMAADCPVIITENHSLDVLPDNSALREVAPNDVEAISALASHLIAEPAPPGDLQNQVKHLSWKNTALQLRAIYDKLLSQ